MKLCPSTDTACEKARRIFSGFLHAQDRVSIPLLPKEGRFLATPLLRRPDIRRSLLRPHHGRLGRIAVVYFLPRP
jgi:hypothetical protein